MRTINASELRNIATRRPSLRWNARNLVLAALLSAISFFQGAITARAADLVNVSLIELGATAKGTGPACDRPWAWSASGALSSAPKGGGMMFGVPPDGIKGGRIDIRLIVPVDIAAIEVVPLDYHGSIQPKAIDISIDGKLLKHAELENKPEQPVRIPVEAHGQLVSVLITECYPPQTMPDGKPGAFSGGWTRVRVLSTTDVASMLKPVDKFDVPEAAANIAPTSGAAVGNAPEVTGQPRMTQGHPCTLWDKEDIAHYKEMLKTSKELQAQFAGLQKSVEVRMTQPLGIPQPLKGPDGQYRHISDQETFQGTSYAAIHTQLSLDIANLGTMYVLTGDAKYAEFCKKLLLAYADAFPNYVRGARPGFSHAPSLVFDQGLGDSIWIIPVARGYDLIHDLPSITPEERKHIEEDFLKADIRFLIRTGHSGFEASTNWSAIITCAALTVGYATDEQSFIDTASYGINGTKEKPTGGLFDRHFSEKAINADGLWVEGAMGYQFMALQALIMDAEMLWHHGIDMYRYRDCALKRLFDSPIEYSYPDLSAAAFHDSHHESILGGDSYLYEYAYRRYRDPAYLTILNQTGMHLGTIYQGFPVSVLYDRDPKDKSAPPEWKSVNFFGVGYGMLRTSSEAGTQSLTLEYGPVASHGHPDKLTLDLFAFNDQLIMDPGCIWYEKPLYRRWYRTTMAHPTLVVDELDQTMCGAHLVVFGPANEMGIQRAWTRDAYPGVTMDRALFMTPNYVADIFGAFARLSRKMDLAWHIRGQFSSDLQLAAMKFPEPVENGYNELTNVRHVETDKPWAASIARNANVARFVASGGTPTDVIVADGHLNLETPPTILERRNTSSTVYGNVVDISGAKDGYVKSVSQQGGLDAGYGLLKIETAKGTDLCFVAYRPGSFKAGDLETDSMQAFVLRDGKNVKAIYLGGGKTLKADGGSLERSEPGLAYLEKAENGSYILSNPSSTDATITVTVPGLSGMSTYVLDAKGKRTTSGSLASSGGVVRAELKGGSKLEIAPKGEGSVSEFRQAALAKRQAAKDDALAKTRQEYEARTKARETEAKEKPAPANTLLVVGAGDFTGQGGGEVNLSDKKRAIIGKAIVGWNDEGHWLEWTFDAPAEGYYNLTLCYCSDLDKIERQITINGEVQEPFAPMIFPSTGGWANGSDDWRLMSAVNPGGDQPLLIKFKQGKNAIRLTNMNARGINVNYLAVTSPDVKPTREILAEKIKK